MVMFGKVRAIMPHTLRFLYMTDSCYMTPLPAILVLWYTWVHICTLNYYNETTGVEPLVNDFLSIGSILCVPNVNTYDSHVGFGGYLDDVWFRGKDNVIEQVIILQNIFDIIWWNSIVHLFADVWNTYNLEVWLWLW